MSSLFCVKFAHSFYRKNNRIIRIILFKSGILTKNSLNLAAKEKELRFFASYRKII
ncbi:hypothetical protein D920_03058 [Enterococcus faecalis 13-SD-W-01]|nr:hypothetical protein D920_03058 [Enterococcus faecalis 13-SD-W-01]